MSNPFEVITHGFHELEQAFKVAAVKVDPATAAALRAAARPIQQTAQNLAVANISHIGPAWSRMRIGRVRTNIYIAEKQRRQAGHGPGYGRPNLSPLLYTRALAPAVRAHEEETKAAITAAVLAVSRGIGEEV